MQAMTHGPNSRLPTQSGLVSSPVAITRGQTRIFMNAWLTGRSSVSRTSRPININEYIGPCEPDACAYIEASRPPLDETNDIDAICVVQ